MTNYEEELICGTKRGNRPGCVIGIRFHEYRQDSVSVSVGDVMSRENGQDSIGDVMFQLDGQEDSSMRVPVTQLQTREQPVLRRRNNDKQIHHVRMQNTLSPRSYAEYADIPHARSARFNVIIRRRKFC